jgi:hypothetical protein
MRRRLTRNVSKPGTPNMPQPIRVQVQSGQPSVVDGERVQEQLEDWLVEGWWWTEAPIRRRYWEVVTASGRNREVFRDLLRGGWYAQDS